MKRILKETRRRRRQRQWKGLNASGCIAGASSSSTIRSNPSRVCYVGTLYRREENSQFLQRKIISSRSMSTSTVASVSCWVKDVLRTKSLNPPNPILQSLPSPDDVLASVSNPTGEQNERIIELLPKFSMLQPHHLEKAAQEIRRQYDMELAQLEVRLTSAPEDSGDEDESSLSDLLLDMGSVTAPLVQMKEISELYTGLASPPDQIDHWKDAADQVDSVARGRLIENFYRSGIIYRALMAASSEHSKVSESFLVPFRKRGAHIDGNEDAIDRENDHAQDDAEGLQQIQAELAILNDRLGNIVSYDRASKAMRLQCMSDMYNCIGLSRMQAEILSTKSIWELARLQHNHMVVSPKDELIDGLFPEIASFLQPYLPTQTKLDLEGVGAFLNSKSEAANKLTNSVNAEEQKSAMIARYDFKQRIRMHGVLKGLIDFCDGILGITVVEETDAVNEATGWNKNVRLLHLYEKPKDRNEEEKKDLGRHLGTIYLDPFADSYWRTDDAKELVTTRLFSQQTIGQTVTPVVIMALKITPIWDDTPVPMTWKETRDFLYQFGKAVQLILTQSCHRESHHTMNTMMNPEPLDTSEFLAHFLEMWIQNDGFLHRLVQLSQDELMLEESTIKLLRKELQKEKALEMMNTMFLSALQLTVFDEFDPRGDETLVALQERLAVQYLPNSNLPDPSDLSPLLAVFQKSGMDQKMSAYGTLWSEVLAAMVYEQFQKTDLRDREVVEKLGIGIRDLFLRKSGTNGSEHMAMGDFQVLLSCDTTKGDMDVSGASLRRVYQFKDSIEIQ